MIPAHELAAALAELRAQVDSTDSEAGAREVLAKIAGLTARLQRGGGGGAGVPAHPAVQAAQLDKTFRLRPHIVHLSERIAAAYAATREGHNRQLVISAPPRSGKSVALSLHTPLWLLRRDPALRIVTTSYDPALSAQWARRVRREIESHPELGIRLRPDSLGGSRWETTEGGGIFSTSVRGAMTGRGAHVLLIDDPIRDFVEAHSPTVKQNLWEWWLAVAQTRLEPPFLVAAISTRWSQDDFLGRLLSTEFAGDPTGWENIVLPALAEADDALGRAPGQPLLSPTLPETPAQATARWAEVKESVGTHVFAAMYQQRPAPATGAIFDPGWWWFWTTDPSRVGDEADGAGGAHIVLLPPPDELARGRWLDSWDTSFKGGGDWVVGQRWVRSGPRRFLIAQRRGRWSFTQTLAAMKEWARTDDEAISPHGHLVHERLIEDKANGPAILDTLRAEIAGLKPINPTTSKESRARAITPEIESGHVFLPHPGDPGHGWVNDLLGELRDFSKSGSAPDDQVDALTQALSSLRQVHGGRITIPGGVVSRRRIG